MSSKIDTLVLIDGQPWLTADSGSWMGEVRRELDYVSCSPVQIDGDEFMQMSETNVYAYQRDERQLPAIGIGDSAYIAADVYQLIAGAARALDDSWQFLGANLMRIQPVVSQNTLGSDYLRLTIRAKRLYPDLHVHALARTFGGELLVEFDETSDDSSERLSADTLLPLTVDPEIALLAGKPHETVAPFLFTALRGDGLDELARQVLALGEQVRATASESLILESNAPEVPPSHQEDYDVFERITYDCMGGGELALELTKRVTYNSGGFAKTETLENYRYSDCQVTLADEDPLLPAGAYRLDGLFVFDDLNDVVFQNYTHALTRQQWQQLSLDSPGLRSSLTTAETILDADYVVSPPSPTVRTTLITSHKERLDGEITLSIRPLSAALPPPVLTPHRESVQPVDCRRRLRMAAQ